jgi:hypothetical protein
MHEHVHQRAGQQQQIGQGAEKMGAMLGVEIKTISARPALDFHSEPNGPVGAS